MQTFNTRAEYEAALQTGTVGEHVIVDELVDTSTQHYQAQIDALKAPATYYLGYGDLSEEERHAMEARA